MQLIYIALATEFIYLVYIVAFPLISNTQAGGPAADLEILMRDYRWFAPLYVLGILLLYYLFWQAIKIVSRFRDQPSADRDSDSGEANSTAPSARFTGRLVSPLTFHLRPHQLKLLILTFGFLFSFTLAWLYPITANDLFRYVVRGRIWAIYGESPMLVPPNAFPDDPYLPFAGEFGDWVSGYGPLWEVLVQLPLRLGAAEMVPGVVSLKLIITLCYLICAVLIGWFAIPEKGSSLTALTFFAWNPLILMQGSGNGHNDMVFMVFLVLAIIFWQRKLWWAAVLAMSLAVLAKAPALLMLPLLGVVILRHELTWNRRILKGIGSVLISLLTAYLIYSLLGPVSETLQGVSDMLTTRQGFAIASGLRMVLREVIPRGGPDAAINLDFIGGVQALRASIPCNPAEISTGTIGGWLTKIGAQLIPCNVPETMPRTTARYIFIIFYGWLLLQLWRNKLNLVTAGFLAYFSQLMLGRTFRIWYPMWLVPLTAIHFTPATFWRTTLFCLTAELSIVNYFVAWRWWLRNLPWDKLGLLAQNFYWPVMHILTVPWLFGIPLFGPIIIRANRSRRNSQNSP